MGEKTNLTYIKFTAYLATSVHYILMFKWMFKGQFGIVCYYNVLFQCWICLNVLNKVFKNCTVRCLQKILNITFVEEWKKNPFETRYIILNNAYRIKLITNVQLLRFELDGSKHNARETTCMSSNHVCPVVSYVSYLITYSTFNIFFYTQMTNGLGFFFLENHIA